MRHAIKHLMEFNREPIAFVERLHGAYGDIASIRLAHKRFHFIFNAEDIQSVLSVGRERYQKSRLIFNKIQPVTGKEGLVQLGHEFGRVTRKATNPLFHKGALDNYLPVLQRYTDELTTVIKHTSSIDIHHLMVSYALNTAISIITGNNNQQLTAALANSFIELNRLCGQLIRQPINIHRVLPTKTQRKLRHHKAVINQCINQMIAQADLEHDNLITALLSSNDSRLRKQQYIQDQVRTFLFAGFETTAASLSFCFYLLAKYPNTQNTLRAGLPKTSILSLENVNQLKYTRACYQEALRLYPPAWILAREARSKHSLRGNKIHKGDQIILCVKQIQNDKAYWNNPSVFTPERFLESNKLKHRFSYIPFGFGERICSGMQLALVEASYVIARLLSSFEFSLDDSSSLPLEAMITLHPAKPVMLKARALT